MKSAIHSREAPVKASDRVYEAMKDEIITMQLPPGSLISELLLAKRYQTSRTPVREACQLLQKDGLLEAVPHKGFFVAEITMKQVQDIYQLRVVLEGSCSRIAAEKITRTELQELEALARPITFTASNQQSFRRSSELNHRFHLRIAEITGNEEMLRILSNILDKITRAQYLEAKKAPMIVGPEHEEIVRAIKGRDPDRAEKAMVGHIQSSLDRLLNVIFGSKLSSSSSPNQKS